MLRSTSLCAMSPHSLTQNYCDTRVKAAKNFHIATKSMDNKLLSHVDITIIYNAECILCMLTSIIMQHIILQLVAMVLFSTKYMLIKET